MSEHDADSINLIRIQRQLFNLLDDFFISIAEKPAASFGNFDDALITLKDASHLSKIDGDRFNSAYENLRNFYAENATLLYRLAKKIAGFRLVVGGGNYFLETQLSSVQRMLLYADTVLIPDPVFARLDDQTEYNRFNQVEMLRGAFHLLKLKPLVDADLPYQAVFVFPSFESSLTENDKVTQAGIDQMICLVMSHHLRCSIESISELVDYAKLKPDLFLHSVERSRLFIGPGQEDFDISISESIKLYREYIQERRTAEFANQALKFSPAILVANGIIERIAPQFHLQENANELGAHPLLPLAVNGHYFRLCAEAYSGRIEKLGHLTPQTRATLDALNQPDFTWLGNVPFEEIARLRMDNENDDFRRCLDEISRELNSATLEESEKVAAEIAKKLAGMMAAHQKKVRQLDDAYQNKYKQLAVPSLLTAASIFIPAIAPFIGTSSLSVAAIGLSGKYMKDKHDEHSERKMLSRSLLGVLTTAKRDFH